MNKIIERNLQITEDLDISILVVSCDAYQDLWRPFFQCFFKYWPDCPYKIYLGSNFSVYSDPRIKNITIGADVDYSSNLIAMLEKVKTSWVLIWVEDLLLSAPVDSGRLNNLISKAQYQGAGSIKLISTFPYAYSSDTADEVSEIPKGIKYRVNIGITLFKKDVLLKLLKNGETAWEIEYNGANRSNKLSEKFFCLNSKLKSNPPISFKNTVGKGRWVRNAVPFLKKEGLSDCLSSRKLQPLHLYIYYKLYLLRLEFYRVFKLYWFEKNRIN